MSITDKEVSEDEVTTDPVSDKVKTETDQLLEFNQLKELVRSAKTKDFEAVEDIDDQRQAGSTQELKERETHRIGEEEYYKLRNKWSWFIFSFVAFMLLFQLFVVCAIGYKWVDFKEYQTFLHLVVGQNFAQIIGMGIIVATFLFPKNPSKERSTKN